MIEARRIEPDHPDAEVLLRAMEAEVAGLYGPPDDAWLASARNLAAYVALYEDGEAVAGGGVKALEPGVCEIKRMFVVPSVRRRGLARRLLSELEEQGRALGFRAVRLDTGPRQPHAEAMYRAAGYREIPDYNANRYASFWAEKPL